MNRRLKYVPMLCVCLIGMLVSCGTVKRASGLSGNKAVVEEKDPLTPEQRRKYDYFFLEALRMKEKGDLDAAFEMYSHCLDIYPHCTHNLSVSIHHPAAFHTRSRRFLTHWWSGRSRL